MTLATELKNGPKNYYAFEHYFIFTFLSQQASTKELIFFRKLIPELRSLPLANR
jgi:hypothetical protein